MGLDFSIELHAKKKGEDIAREVEMAYWRKCYAIRTNLMHTVDVCADVIKQDDDYMMEIPLDNLNVIITYLAQLINSPNCEEFTDSIWGKTQARLITVKQLARLCSFESFFDWLTAVEKAGTSVKEEMWEDEFDSDDLLLDDFNEDRDLETLKDIFINRGDYDLTIRIYNSY